MRAVAVNRRSRSSAAWRRRRARCRRGLAAALADLPDDAPIIVHVASENDPKAVYDEIITSAGHGNVGWGDGYGMKRDPIFALECHWHTKDQLLIRPKCPRPT
ncbi:DUF6225 family protein [Nonomuraea sp. NPDC049709]|uniref:DUF6225 family protein n=1 Tax=Nonomuraea sp. NPDC049709 TaxID=3154736 RepID=UPI00343CB0F8